MRSASLRRQADVVQGNDLRAPDYLALNPEGKVPTLVVDGRPLTEVAAILFYLARRFPDAELLPRENIEAEAQALSWMSFIASTLHPARQRGMDYPRRSTASPTGVWETAGRWHTIRSPTSICSGCTGGSPIRSSLRRKTFPNLTAHYARMMARPAVQRTIEVETAVGYELPA